MSTGWELSHPKSRNSPFLTSDYFGALNTLYQQIHWFADNQAPQAETLFRVGHLKHTNSG